MTHRTIPSRPTPLLQLGLCLLFAVALAAALPAHAAEPNPAFPPASATDVGLSPRALAELAEKVRGYFEEGQIVGAELLVIKDRRTVLHETVGWRDREQELEMAPGTIFNIRSMTKPLTGAAIQMLIDEGALRPSDKAAQYLPGFAAKAGDGESGTSEPSEGRSSDITVEQLLTHRSGLPVTILSGINQYPSLVDMANAAGVRGPQFPPGSKFWYSDPGTDVLGAIVETVTGERLEEFWQKRLFDPLGMSDSWVPRDPEDSRWKRLATAYIGGVGKWNPFWTPAGDKPLYPYAWGSQTVYSTPTDYARFLALWLDGGVVRGPQGERRLLSQGAIERTLTPASEATGMGTNQRMPTGFRGLEAFYGQMAVLWAESLDAEPRVIGHSGSDGTFAWAWPEQDLMVLYFTQSRGGISGLSLERWIDELLLQQPSGASPADSKLLTKLYEEIQGEYLADFGSLRNTTIEVKLSNDRPALDLGYGRIIELRDPDAEGKWAFAINNNSRVSFSRNRAGQIDALRLHEGSWDFEAPRKGVPIESEGDPELLERYVGTYRVIADASEALKSEGSEDAPREERINLTVQIENGRLTIDKSQLPANLPADRFALLPPDDEGRFVYRVNPRLAAVFDESGDGEVAGLRVFQDGEVKIVGERVAAAPEDTVSLEQVLSLLPNVDEERIAKLGGVRMQGTITVVQSGATAPITMLASGTQNYRSSAQLPGANFTEIANEDGALLRFAEREFVHEGQYLEQARLAHPLLRLLDWSEIFDTVELVGGGTVAGRRVHHLRTTKGETSPTEHFVDAETGDVLRTKTVVLSVNGDVPTTTRFADFREVDGLRFPHRITASTQINGDVIIEYETVETGVKLPQGTFDLAPENSP